MTTFTRIAGTRVLQDYNDRWYWHCYACYRSGGTSRTEYGAKRQLERHLNSARHIDTALAGFEKALTPDKVTLEMCQQSDFGCLNCL